MKIAVPLLTVLIATTSAFGFADQKKIDAFIDSEMRTQKIPGVSLAVVKDGKPVTVKGYGIANIEHNVPVKPETIFQSGSVGKQFTSMAVMMLAEEGKLSIDDPISKFLGDVPAEWSALTVRHLLTHTSGMTDYPADFDYRRDYSEADLLVRAKLIPLSFKPGEKWDYSNLGYVMLGIIIRKASGQFYGDFLRDRVFRPLGMSTARVISEADIVPNRAAGYQLVNGELKNQDWVAPTLNTTADGALYLTTLDMIKWDAALRQGKLLSREGYDLMWSPVKLNDGKNHPYGFAWRLSVVNGIQVIEHGGSWQGFKSYIARYPDFTVIVFANLANASPDKLAHGVAEIVDPRLVRKAVAKPDPK